MVLRVPSPSGRRTAIIVLKMGRPKLPRKCPSSNHENISGVLLQNTKTKMNVTQGLYDSFREGIIFRVINVNFVKLNEQAP